MQEQGEYHLPYLALGRMSVKENSLLERAQEVCPSGGTLLLRQKVNRTLSEEINSARGPAITTQTSGEKVGGEG